VTLAGAVLDARERRRLIGWVAPEIGLYPSLTGIEHLRLFAGLRGVTLSDQDARSLLAEVGLRARLRETVRTYSSGMRQRLRYACAILHKPPLLLLDEPYAALDGEGVALVQRIVGRQREHGISVIAGNDERELVLGDTRLALGAT
jgi:heme exporter protein A